MGWEIAAAAVNDGSYTTQSVGELRDMLRECMGVSGSNPVVLHKVNHAAEIIRGELASRFMSGEPTWQAL
jgi:hypothetical protein